MKFNPFDLAEKIPVPGLKRRALDVILNVAIPFNRWLGFRLAVVSPDRVQVHSPDVLLRRNHVGGAHACALALMGEYAAGLVVAQRFPIEAYRVIIGELRIRYHKQGRGDLRAEAQSPAAWPAFDDEGQAWVEMKTEIRDKAGDLVAECETRWQVKDWTRVRGKKT